MPHIRQYDRYGKPGRQIKETFKAQSRIAGLALLLYFLWVIHEPLVKQAYFIYDKTKKNSNCDQI